ncbi:hypothetical protein SK128_021101 [Halocaridina rubra]|uniref:C2H2-type domain-containing protein n=1 Tax=Halocaridina rubra TaxID=373956 RepID=A0AAN8WX66_HALRR
MTTSTAHPSEPHLFLCSFAGVKLFDPKLDKGPEVIQLSKCKPTTVVKGTGVVLQGTTLASRALYCAFCNKVFAGRNQHQRLQYHTLTHTGEKPHACPHCPHRARLKFNLRKHIRALHKDLLPD